VHERVHGAARDLSRGDSQVEQGKAKILQIRNYTLRAWWAISENLMRDDQSDLAAQVRQFAKRMPPSMTEREWLTARVIDGTQPPRTRGGPSR
jgi:hypothetical protein